MVGGGFGGLFWIIILGLVIWLVVDRRPLVGGPSHSSQKSALDTLDQAYASGSLDRETYLQKKNDLSG